VNGRSVKMVYLVNELRDRLQVDRKIYNIVFGTNQLKKVAILDLARQTLNHKGSEF